MLYLCYYLAEVNVPFARPSVVTTDQC